MRLEEICTFLKASRLNEVTRDNFRNYRMDLYIHSCLSSFGDQVIVSLKGEVMGVSA